MTALPVETAHIGPAPRIAVDRLGDGPAVLCLHGIGGGRINWTDQLAALAAGGWTGLAWDARGYGLSDDVEGARDFAHFAADLLRVLDHYGIGKVCLLGLSMGGRIALDFQGRHPDRVGALVLADTSGGTAQSRDPAKIAAFLAARRKPLLEDGLTPADIAPGIARSFAGPGCPPDAFARIVETLAALRTDSYLKTLEAVTRYHDFPPFSRITVPTLVLNGEHDPIAPPAMGREMADAIPGATHMVIPDAGHASNIENPAAFNAALLGWLAAHWPASPARMAAHD